jgi:TolA-binding protein
MNEDLLSEATRALRETEEVSELEARATRARVMSGLHQTRVRRRTRYAYLLPIAATFVAASAWGAANGNARLVWASLERIAHISEPASVVAPSARTGSNGERAPSSLPVASAPAEPSTAEPPAEPKTLLVPAPAPTVSVGANLPRAAAPDRTLALYRAAHRAHFVDHDPVRALAAWDAYLAAAPNGELAPEAHYNRALSLVRLGRNAEARSALEPFANGSYGGYRQSEASALLERLGP